MMQSRLLRLLPAAVVTKIIEVGSNEQIMQMKSVETKVVKPYWPYHHLETYMTLICI